MKNYSLTHLTDGALLSALTAVATSDRATTAELLAHIAEVDARKLYVPAGHPSMQSYCVRVLRLSEHAALKRIRAARATRQFPALYPALTDGRLNLCAVVMLAPRLTEDNAADLIAGATHKTRIEIERLLAARFPRADVPAAIVGLPSQPGLPAGELATWRVEAPADPLATWRVEAQSQSQVEALAPQRFALKLTIGQQAHDQLRYAQSLLGLKSSNDLPEVLSRAIDELVATLEKRKFAATDRRRRGARRPSANPRHIPAHVKNAVWERDAGRCTFVSDAGNRCPADAHLEYDHIVPVANGGEATIANLRLRCRAHNQYTAERTFGAEFMANKREQARSAIQRNAASAAVDAQRGVPVDSPLAPVVLLAASDHAEAVEPSPEDRRELEELAREVAAAAAERARELDVIPWLRRLGVRATDAKLAAERCESMPDAPLEERVRFALQSLAPPMRRPRQP